MSKVIGITGLIGTGKSTIASILQGLGAPVHDADAIVHMLYEDKAITTLIANEFDMDEATLTREKLMDSLRNDAKKRAKLEGILHPLVRQSQLDFLLVNKDKKICVLDVPLLFETKADAICDEVWVTTCSRDTQKERVLKRTGFTAEKFDTILAWQGGDTWKKELATHVIDTDLPMSELEEHVHRLLGSCS